MEREAAWVTEMQDIYFTQVISGSEIKRHKNAPVYTCTGLYQ